MIFLILLFAISKAAVPFNQTIFPTLKTFFYNLCPNNEPLTNDTLCDVGPNVVSPIICDNSGNPESILFNRRPCRNGVIGTEIGLFRNLLAFDIRDTGMGGSIPQEITLCTALTSILTFGNNLRGNVPLDLVNLNLSICTLMRNIAENNCFDCPVPKLPCTATLKCNTTCINGNETLTTASQTTTTLTESLTSTTTVPTTITTTFLPTITTATTPTTTPPTTIDIKNFPTNYFYTQPTIRVSLNTDGEISTVVEETQTASTIVESLAIGNSSEPISGSENVSIIIGLGCALGITIPVIFVLVCFYGRSKRDREINRSIEEADRRKKNFDEGEKYLPTEVRMNVLPGNYGAIVATKGNVYDVVGDHQVKKRTRQYDIVPTHTPSQYDSVYSVLEE